MCSQNAASCLLVMLTCALLMTSSHSEGLIRGEWGWGGFFVSDCTALELMQDVKWDNCKEPYPSQGGACTPDKFPGGHNYTPGSVDKTMHAALVEGGIDYNCGQWPKSSLQPEICSSVLSGRQPATFYLC